MCFSTKPGINLDLDLESGFPPSLKSRGIDLIKNLDDYAGACIPKGAHVPPALRLLDAEQPSRVAVVREPYIKPRKPSVLMGSKDVPKALRPMAWTDLMVEATYTEKMRDRCVASQRGWFSARFSWNLELGRDLKL